MHSSVAEAIGGKACSSVVARLKSDRRSTVHLQVFDAAFLSEKKQKEPGLRGIIEGVSANPSVQRGAGWCSEAAVCWDDKKRSPGFRRCSSRHAGKQGSR